MTQPGARAKLHLRALASGCRSLTQTVKTGNVATIPVLPLRANTEVCLPVLALTSKQVGAGLCYRRRNMPDPFPQKTLTTTTSSLHPHHTRCIWVWFQTSQTWPSTQGLLFRLKALFRVLQKHHSPCSPANRSTSDALSFHFLFHYANITLIYTPLYYSSFHFLFQYPNITSMYPL